MRYIDNWLTGLGLEYIIPKLKDNGINTPKKLAQLTLRDMYEVGRRYTVFIAIIIWLINFNQRSSQTVGVEDAEDRKKLYFLIQRLQTVSELFRLSLIFLLSHELSGTKHTIDIKQ